MSDTRRQPDTEQGNAPHVLTQLVVTPGFPLWSHCRKARFRVPRPRPEGNERNSASVNP